MSVYNKLVRDRLPEIIARHGVGYETRVLSPNEYLPALHEKLREETEEYLKSRGSKSWPTSSRSFTPLRSNEESSGNPWRPCEPPSWKSGAALQIACCSSARPISGSTVEPSADTRR